MRKKLIYLLALFILTGCSTTHIPGYIVDKYPYKRIFIADFDQVLKAATQTFQDMGWAIAKTTHPSEYERDKGLEGTPSQQILLFTGIRQTSLFIGTRYTRLNVYLRETQDKTTEVEIRYLTVNAFFFKTFYHYKNNKAVERIFKHIQELLEVIPKLSCPNVFPPDLVPRDSAPREAPVPPKAGDPSLAEIGHPVIASSGFPLKACGNDRLLSILG